MTNTTKARWFRFKFADGSIKLCVDFNFVDALAALSCEEQEQVVGVKIQPVTLFRIEQV